MQVSRIFCVLPDNAVFEILNEIFGQSSKIRSVRFAFFHAVQHLTEISFRNAFQKGDLFAL